MSMWDKSYCATRCDQEDCERNLKYNKPKDAYYTVATFDDFRDGVKNTNHEDCMWKIEGKTDFQKLKDENAAFKEQLDNFIPRRRVRRVYKMLGNILEKDREVKPYVETLKKFINKIEKEGKAEADNEIKTAIEVLLSVRER